MIIRKGEAHFEAAQKERDSKISRAQAVQEYNIMMGNLEDPAEDEEEEVNEDA